MKLGTCGRIYFKVNNFLADYGKMDPEEKDWKDIYDHKVQAFADFFDLVEVNYPALPGGACRKNPLS